MQGGFVGPPCFYFCPAPLPNLLDPPAPEFSRLVPTRWIATWFPQRFLPNPFAFFFHLLHIFHSPGMIPALSITVSMRTTGVP